MESFSGLFKFEKKTKAFNFTHQELLDALEYAGSASKAAQYLGVNYVTFKRYARRYVDENGKNVMDIAREKYLSKVKPPTHIKRKNKKEYTNYGTPNFIHNRNYSEALEDILDGKIYGYDSRKFRKRILLSGIIPRVCESCGHSECRKTDGNYPLLVHYRDGDWRNKTLSNIFLLCFNCYFMNVGSLGHYYQGFTYGTKSKPRYDGKEKQTWSKKNKE
ncbi:HNHc domain containing protein [Microcystis phage Mel-JY01]